MVKNNIYSLTISPDKKYWDFSKNILFGGKWCINNINKRLLLRKKYKVLDDKVFEKNFNLKQIKFCDELYEKLLEEISLSLNQIHKINWNKRSWRVVIGPWLSRYIAIINNRLNLLIHSKSGNKILFKKINFKNDSLISYDIRDFTDKAVSHDWNEKLIRRLNQIYLDKKFDLKYLQKINFEKFDKIKENSYS